MNIVVSSGSKEWSDFEKNAWSEADKEHYGQEINWDKKDFHITAIKNDKVIGSLRFDIRAGVAYVDAVIVDPEFRGKGIGKQLMLEAERVAKENKAHKIYLHTGKNWNSVGMYEKLGYQKSSELPNHYVSVDFIEMTKFIED